jgi:lysozyme
MLNYSDACVQLTKASEGLCLACYADPATGAFQTVGYGHKVKPGEDFSGGITEAQADAMLTADLDTAWKIVNVWCIPPDPLTQGQVDALTDFVFNEGAKAFSNSTLLRRINAGDIAGAAGQFDLWTFSGGKVLPGLVKRRAAEKALFLGADDLFVM